MFGKGILTGLGVTLKHFFNSYKADQRRGLGHRYLPKGQEHTGPVPGFVTVQYPEEKLQLPQNFRFFPMLIKDDVTGEDWCTACGICARVCPPQCIWIVRAAKPDGKPEPKPEEFYIDTSICMQCAYCVEYCPFDAIKMDHNYELSTQERWKTWIFDKDRLTVPNSYYTQLHPRDAAAEKTVRDEKEAKKKTGGRAAKQAAAPAALAARPATVPATLRPAPAAAPAAPAATSETVHAVVVETPTPNRPAPASPAQDNPAPAAAEVGPVTAAPAASAAAGTAAAEASAASPNAEVKKPKRTPEELAALKAANAARRAQLDNSDKK
jgi:NADH-quinone oxidoreductase subunit I